MMLLWVVKSWVDYIHSTGLVLQVGVEPTRPFGHCILSAARLPLRHWSVIREGFEPSLNGLSDRFLCRWDTGPCVLQEGVEPS